MKVPTYSWRAREAGDTSRCEAGRRTSVQQPTAEDRAMVERERELEQIDAALERARAGAGSVVVVEGHAGIGKTRLMEVAAGRADRAGLAVLQAQGRELESGF